MAEEDRSCCVGREDAPVGDHDVESRDTGEHPSPEDADETAVDTARMTRLAGGTFRMGTDDPDVPADGEGPVREVELEAFSIDTHAVTNAEFLQFVRETGYTTDAERYGWSFVFEAFLPDETRSRVIDTVDAAPWWAAVEGATWLHPAGPGSSVVADDLLAHPVVHVSWRDAAAYAEWAGKRLPTEAEWERAARGGLEGARFPWGDELHPDGEHRCNIWQGEFPEHDTGADGYRGTAPVDAFAPNGHGLYNAAGNVWEWCGDWFSPDWHGPDRPATRENPTGPADGDAKVIRGGSYLCHRSWCNRYRVAARTRNTPDSSTGNIGFRCALDG